MVIKRAAIFFTLFLYNFTCLAQADSSFLFKTDAALEAYTQANPVEKVYLHLDQQNYGVQDTIWFKAYTVIGNKHQLSALSGVLYVELISPKDSVLQRQILPITSGITWGGIPLSASFPPANYHIRAYTKWMQNQAGYGFYNATVRVGGMPPSSGPVAAQTKPDVQFLPEGGNLVAGLRSRVAVKSVNVKGMGEDISGIILDNEGNIVSEFSTTHLAMGVFPLLPESGKTYHAKIRAGGLTEFVVPLPGVLPKGFVMSVVDKRDSLQLIIAANGVILSEKKNTSFYLIGQSTGKVYFTTTGNIGEARISATVDKARFPTGIARFTLFSEEGLPLCERIAFIRNTDTLTFNMAASASISRVRQMVKFNIGTANGNKPALQGSYSVAITNENLSVIDEAAEQTIITSLLLQSELTGNIENPNYYFLKESKGGNEDLDLLMLTQGYRRFDWQKAFKPESATRDYQPEKSLRLEGTVNTRGGLPVANGNINLLAAKENFTADTTTNAAGRFTFQNLELNDSVKLVLQAKTAKNSKAVTISVDSPVYPVIETADFSFLKKTMTTAESAVLKQSYEQYKNLSALDSINKKHQLKEVIIKAKKSFTPKLEYSSNLQGPGHADQVILGEILENKGCINLKECLSYKMNGVILRGGSFFSVRALARINVPPMVVIIDGAQVPLESLENISASNVYAIEVLRSGANLAIYGSNASGGAIVVTLRKGFTREQLQKNQFEPQGLITALFKGYDKMREFYNPGFENPNAIAELAKKPTIYWKPNLITDKDGKASFEFYNPAPGNYRLVIEGIDDEGKLGRAVYKYKVE
jgi:hypothetical protein